MRARLSLCLALCAAVSLPATDTFVVLPFANWSKPNPAGQKPANIDWIGESLAEFVRETLQSEGVMTLDREDRLEAVKRLGLKPDARLTRASIIKIGEALDADQVVYGEYELTDPPVGTTGSRGSLRISAHVLDVKRRRQGPEFSEGGALEDLASMQNRLAWRALYFLMPGGAPSELAFQQRHPSLRVDAIENYTRGLLAPSAELRHRFLTQAVRLEPRFSQAHYQLGLLHYEQQEPKIATEWLERVGPLDAHYRDAMFLLGLCRFALNDYKGAEAAFGTVLKEVPLNEVLNNIGVAQSRRNAPEALNTLQKALDGDPTDPVYHFNVGYVLWKQGRFDEASQRFQSVLEREANDKEAAQMLARCQKKSALRPQEIRLEIVERLKTGFEETAYRQLKALVGNEKP
jgi:tetratricopeptide (TPR) repeat protein